MKKEKIIFKLVTLFLIILYSSICFSYPSPIDGSSLLKMCKEQIAIVEGSMSQDPFLAAQQAVSAGSCAGFIAGCVDTKFSDNIFINLITSVLIKNGKLSADSEIVSRLNKLTHVYCLPSNVGELQLAKIIVKYLEDHPEKLNESATLVVQSAFRNAFPCLNNSSSIY